MGTNPKKGTAMKLFAVNGSPTKKKGMTHIMMEHFLKGAEDAGADVETLFISDKKINFCTGCFHCWVKTPGTCIFKDDMPELLQKISESDVMILGTPLYADGMTAQTKMFIDRIIPLIQPEIEFVEGHYRHAKRLDTIPKIGLLSLCGFYEMDNFDTLVDHVKAICKNFQSEFVGAVLRPSSYTLAMEDFYPENVPAVKQAIYTAGKELVETGGFSEETLKVIASQPVTSEENLERANAFWGICKDQGKFLFHQAS